MLPIVTACALAWPGAALADAAPAFAGEEIRRELPPYLQCVPYARERSGIQIYGDAHTWWHQAAGRYQRGTQPRVGAVMAFRPSGNMVLGHVAAVARVIDSRTVLLDHANWSPIDGRRGQIERGVKAVDVSPANDWSEVRVWYAPLGDLGTTAWPVAGFIYNEPDRGFSQERVTVAAAVPEYVRPSGKLKKQFDQAFAAFAGPPAAAVVARKPAPKPRDPIAVALARYGS
jgi:surface antigen